MDNPNLSLEIAKILDAAVPANDDESSSPEVPPPAINITATGQNIIAVNGSKIKTGWRIPRWLSWMLIPALFVLSFLVFLNLKISSAQAQTFSDSVMIVAECEHKHHNKIHSEFRKKYKYRAYADMSVGDYYSAIQELSSRKCA
jgi:hypothetical protein